MLVAAYEEQLALFEETAFEQFSETEDDAFKRLDSFALPNEIVTARERLPATELDESRFISLNEGAFSELNKF
jgi:hypothetical protein